MKITMLPAASQNPHVLVKN